ncbi:N-acetylneuraminate 9-O-acetyltransferase [Bagarius yarrelli]|uniref:N-acetylneuraminate 9-O-acetyltransferase n=1 Tax=Bagarius yarrelli TaxID=175774 RepID=A0A556TPM1_BAGYA|nr:N-acetylneuraminate 9-O-acetyltransferase [Bagarius yarrelli]
MGVVILSVTHPEGRGANTARPSARCHGGANMAILAYSPGKREINQYFSIKNAKLLSLIAVVLLTVFHAVSRYYGGGDTCEWLLSNGRFLGDSVWQPYGCMMHKYKINEAKACLTNKKLAFIGDSRIRQLFYSFIQIVHPETKEEGTKKPSSKPDVIIIGAATWSIKLHSGSSETLLQYKTNLTSLAAPLEKLSDHSEVFWVIQGAYQHFKRANLHLKRLFNHWFFPFALRVDPVYEKVLSENRKMITNERIDLYNAAAFSALSGDHRNAKARVKFLQASRQAAMETITESEDGLHLPVSARNVGAMVLMNYICNKVLKPIDGSCCQSVPPLSVLQKLSAGLFLVAAVCSLLLHALGYSGHWKSKPVSDVESGEEKKTSPAAVPFILKNTLQSICKMGLIMLYFYLCDRADIFMKEQKFYTHSTFFIPLIYIFMLGFFYNENTKEAKLLNREQTDEWKGWMQLVILVYHISGASAFIPVYMHVRVLVAAYLFQTGYGHFSFFWLKGDFGLYRVCQVLFRLNFLVIVLCLVMDRSYQFYYFVPLVTFWFVIIYATMVMWPQILQIKANGSRFWHLVLLLKLSGLLFFICLFAYSQGFFESVFSVWPVSKLFELQGSVHEWWFRWKLDRFAVINGMLFAFIYLVLQKYQILSEGKGEPLFSTKISNCLLFVSVISFLTYSIWASSCKDKTKCNEMHPYISVVQILAFVLIRNIPGYVRSLYSSFFAWFGKISLELFICQYHIWLAADTKGILVLIPGLPSLNIIISTFIFVCVAHEISQITNDLAQVAIPKDSGTLLRRLLATGLFMGLFLMLSNSSWA